MLFTVGCTGRVATDIVVRSLEYEASLSEALILATLMTSSDNAEELKRTQVKCFLKIYFINKITCINSYELEVKRLISAL